MFKYRSCTWVLIPRLLLHFFCVHNRGPRVCSCEKAVVAFFLIVWLITVTLEKLLTSQSLNFLIYKAGIIMAPTSLGPCGIK